MNYTKLLRRGLTLILLVVFVLSSGANAYLKLTFSEALSPDQIDLFWSGDASGPTEDGRAISDLPGITPDEITPGKPDSTPPVQMYHFWSGGAPFAASESNKFRVWDSGLKLYGSHYTGLTTKSNLKGGVSTSSMSVVYSFVKANVGEAIISQYTETNTVIYDPASISKTVKFTSLQPQVGGYDVQIMEALWDVNGTESPGTLDPDGTLATKIISGMSSGDVYNVKVKHKGYWDAAFGPWSDIKTYTVGEMPDVGGASIFNFNFIRLVSGSGINSFAVPSDTCEVTNTKKDSVDVTVTTTSVSNALNICNVLNEIYGSPLVRTFGYWDQETQTSVGVVVQYSGSDITNTGALSAYPLVPGMGYQVYIAPDADVAVDIEFTLQ